MLSELINNVYANWDLIKRLIKQEDPQLYEQWKAGGYLVDEDVFSIYPCLSRVLEKLEDKAYGIAQYDTCGVEYQNDAED